MASWARFGAFANSSLAPRAGIDTNVQTAVDNARAVSTIAPLVFKADAAAYSQPSLAVASPLPSWVIPAAIGALVLVVFLMRRPS